MDTTFIISRHHLAQLSMSKHLLIDLLRNVYRLTQLSKQYDRPYDDVEAMVRDSLSRRQLLQRGLMLTASLGTQTFVQRKPLFDCSSSVSTASAFNYDSRVLVVGAGIAGLTAAYRLKQAGLPIDIIEAAPRIGGRMRSVVAKDRSRSVLSPTIELGGEFIDTNHTKLRSLALELGLELVDLHQSDIGYASPTWYFDHQPLDLADIIALFRPIAEQIATDVQRLGGQRITYRSHNFVAKQFDQISLANYIDRLEGDATIKTLLRVAYLNEFGRDTEEQSCLNLLSLISTNSDEWAIYGTSDERYTILGGNEQVPQRLSQILANEIETGTVLESLRLQSDGRYRVGLRQGDSSFERIYERIILTLPFSVLRTIDLDVDLPPVKQWAIAHLGYGTHTKLLTHYQQPIWRTRYHSTAAVFSDLDFQSIWESSRYVSSGWLANLTGGQQGLSLGTNSPEFQAQRLVSQVEQLFPGIRDLRDRHAIRAYWFGEPYQQGSYSCYLVGQWTTLAGAEAERVGNLWFAGEHCSLNAQGYMEGACETGEAAAYSVLQDLGLATAQTQFRRSILAAST
jgi:monoamine oxidase